MTLPESQEPSDKAGLISWGLIPWGLIVGTLAGAAAASLSDQFRSVLNEDPTISLAIAGSAIGLLAVIIAVITLVLTLRTGLYKDIIASADPHDAKQSHGTGDLGIKSFLAPFRQVAYLSAGAAIVSLVSVLFGPSQGFPRGTGPEPFAVTVFGIGVLLFVWAVVATVRLIHIVQQHAISAAKSDRLDEGIQAAQKAAEAAQMAREASERDAAPEGQDPSSSG
jgi:hypothetical protein